MGMNEREKEARDEHRIDFMFSPDLTPREQAKQEIAIQERLMTIEDDAREMAMDYCGGCKGSDVGCDEQGSYEAFQEQVKLILEDLKAEMTNMTENEE